MPASKPSLPVWVALLGSVIAGVFVSIQARSNGALSAELGNGYVVAVVSFGIGLLIVIAATAFSRRARRGIVHLRAELRSHRLPWWALSGGLGGAFFVMSQGIAASVLGLALFTVGIVAGQVLGGLLLDRIGMGPGGRVGLSPQRVVGTILVVLAVALSAWSQLSAESNADGGAGLLLALPLISGMLVAWQSAVNGLVRSAARSAITSTLVNFVLGTAVLAVVAAVSVLLTGWPREWPSDPLLYLGGFVGPIFIALAALLVRTAGVLLLSMSNVAGQLLASIAFESVAPLAGGLTPWLVVGTLLALVAVIIAALPRRGSRSA